VLGRVGILEAPPPPSPPSLPTHYFATPKSSVALTHSYKKEKLKVVVAFRVSAVLTREQALLNNPSSFVLQSDETRVTFRLADSPAKETPPPPPPHTLKWSAHETL